MRDEGFASALDALYGAIDLPAPLRGEVDTTHALTVDGVRVSLAESANGGAVIVSTILGPVPPAEPQRSQALAALLGEAFPLTADNGAALTLEGDAVATHARVPLNWSAPRTTMGLALRRAVEDVVERAMIHGGQLTTPDRATDPAGDGAAPVPTTVMIFRP